MNNKGIEFNFGWIFAITVGAAVLALGLFAASKVIQQGDYQGNSLTAKQFGILTTALETSLESGKTDKITFDIPARLILECDSYGLYGTQKITVGDLGKETTGVTTAFPAKYYFSQKEITGKEFIIISKPFQYPFHVADILIIWPKSTLYCFLDPPEQLERELKSMARDNVIINTSLQVLSYEKKEECKKASQRVCFGKTTGCDIAVIDTTIRKTGQTVFFDPLEEKNTLLLAGIFSDPETYECQVRRLMHRASTLASLYQEKANLLNGKGCTSSLGATLQLYSQNAQSFNSTREFATLGVLAQTLGGENGQLSCPVF
ncbi:MAG: hypothetical protein AABY00_03615 [Nanoarchaeota archaeon]